MSNLINKLYTIKSENKKNTTAPFNEFKEDLLQDSFSTLLLNEENGEFFQNSYDENSDIPALNKSMISYNSIRNTNWNRMFHHKILSKEEENFYFEQLESGNEEARDILIKHNLRFVLHIIKEMGLCLKLYDYEDFISIGIIGLTKGIDSFDRTKGYALTSYLSTCIKNEIFMMMRKNKKYVSNTNITIDNSTSHWIEGEIDYDSSLVSFDNPQEDVIEKITYEEVLREIKHLSEVEQKVITFTYLTKKPLTQLEIATKLNLSQSYVCRVQKTALKKLRAVLSASPKSQVGEI